MFFPVFRHPLTDCSATAREAMTDLGLPPRRAETQFSTAVAAP